MYVVDVIAAIDGRYICTALDVAVEHAVHYHRLQVGSSRGIGVVTHDTADIVAICYIGIAVAVDHMGCAIKQTNDATYIATTTHGAAQHATVVDTAVARYFVGNGANVCSSADADFT